MVFIIVILLAQTKIERMGMERGRIFGEGVKADSRYREERVRSQRDNSGSLALRANANAE